VVGPAGLTIGRVPGNDWVIPDPYISKQHARISYSNGSFFVESLGRNAIAIGSPGNTLPGNQPRPLRNGDRLFIDQYEMVVTTQQGDPPGTSMAIDDPFAVLPATPGPRAAVGGSARGAGHPGAIPDLWNGAGAGDFSDTGVMDPMEVLGGSHPAEPPPSPVNWHRASELESHFEPPPIRQPAGGSPFDLLEPAPEVQPAAPPPSSAIPDNWDRTNLTFREPAAAAPKRVVPSGSPSPMPRPLAPSPGAGRVSVRDPAPPIKAAKPQPVNRDVRPLPADARVPIIDSPRADEGVRIGGNTDSGSVGGLADLLRGAGLPAQDMSPEVMQDLGKVLRVVVEGVMDVLRARAEIKSQFRLPMTRIQSAENNPLKHSPNVESALHTLLVQRNPGFLSTVQAFEDAFADIRNHQMAMLDGVRAAFESMLESFDPKELEKGFERAAKRGFGSAKAKYWELYVERFSQLDGDADDTFRRLFGDVFAEAYEKQLERLKTLGRNGGKS
jgi:type VI secretion system FHA domain protein